MTDNRQHRDSGIIGRITEHRVGPNLLMLVLIIGGFLMSTRITQEVFPAFEQNIINVAVSYPGAAPTQIEQGVVLPVEEAVRSVNGIADMSSTAREGSGSVRLELVEGVSVQRVYQDIVRAVDAIDTFPDDAEDPRVSYSAPSRNVLDLLVHGNVPEDTLHTAAELTRDRILQHEGVTQARLEDVRSPEIHIDISNDRLREHDLTLSEVAGTVAESARSRSAGSVETSAGEILLEVSERRIHADEFRSIVLKASSGGAIVRLDDVATVSDSYNRKTGGISTFNGERSINVAVGRVGNDETPISVSEAVRSVLSEIRSQLPPSIEISIQSDRSRVYKQRLDLLLKNGFIGLLLVLATLSLFLEYRLAFWVTVGIPTSFLGAFLFLPGMGVTINMISLFAFIIVLGIVVDDAIVAGENIYEYRRRGMSIITAASKGARDIAFPIIISVLTNIVAFLPLAFVPGPTGQIWAVFPTVVATVLTISLVEALLILPAHLAHANTGARTRIGGVLHGFQQRISAALDRFVENMYGPILAFSLRWRYATLALACAILVITLSLIGSGRINFVFLPRVESDTATVTAELPPGTPLGELQRIRDNLTVSARHVVAEHGGEKLSRGIYTTILESGVQARIYLTPADVRPISASDVTQYWRKAANDLIGGNFLRFQSDMGAPGGDEAGVTVLLNHSEIDTLNRAATVLARRLDRLSQVTDVDDGYEVGKPQWNLQVNETGRFLGLDTPSLARQVRNAFYGDEEFKLLRGGNEVTVRVQLPPGENATRNAVSSFMVRLPNGSYVPLQQISTIQRDRSPTAIQRQNGRRVLPVTANIVPVEQTGRILSALQKRILPALQNQFPGLAYDLGGRQRNMRDTFDSFFLTVPLALFTIFSLLALPFRSYSQPLVIMITIPFGLVGAILGHMIMGYNLSVISILGVIALSGVVVNGGLVMIDYINQRRLEGVPPVDAAHAAGIRRFRPIFLTTVTTFGGLMPMILETSVQAKFMVPMAISLGYGVLFSSAFLLFLVPCLYMVIEDTRRLVAKTTGIGEDSRRAAT